MKSMAHIRFVFGKPMLLALLIGFGLLSALLGDDIWDVLSWCALAVPIGAVVYFGLNR